ncbi:low density lipoprotein receptor adapter protein 1-A isoform X2 [Heptranchias perlo]|uniref:low density lipoprotein receptor adapter protein 1-A isoform X2 n=1 Tax=Heptranchias perlo TaxID=212740 RepID=UPI003559DD53
MSLNNFHFIHTIKNSPAVFRRRFKKDKTKSMSHGDPLFKVHYVGMEKIYSLQVEQTTEVVSRLVGKEPAGKASKDHALVVRPRYLEVKEISTGRQITKTYLHDIAYCTADKSHTSVFLYICKSKGQLQCRVFLCNKAEKAKAITVCLAKSFQTAFNQWHQTYGDRAMPVPSSATDSGSEKQDIPCSRSGSWVDGESELSRSLESDEEAEARMHREFLQRASSFHAPDRLDTGYHDVEDLTTDSSVQELVGGEQEGD